jgi:hypothetical protein
MEDERSPGDFFVKDCVLAHIAMGRRAQTLRELRDVLRDVHPGCVYHHFWGTLLGPQWSDREFNNDFASWAYHSLHDLKLAERLAVIDPAEYADLEELRQEVIEVIEEHMDETEILLYSRADQQFHFVRSVIVVFDTYRRLQTPEELASAVPEMSVGSIFYHFIDSRRRSSTGIDDFRAWLQCMGEEHKPVCEALAEVDPFFDSLFTLRSRLAGLFADHLTSRQTEPVDTSEAAEPALPAPARA